MRELFSTVIWKLLKYGLYNRAIFDHFNSSLAESLINERFNLVSKETLLLRLLGCETSKFDIKQFGKGKISIIEQFSNDCQ